MARLQYPTCNGVQMVCVLRKTVHTQTTYGGSAERKSYRSDPGGSRKFFSRGGLREGQGPEFLGNSGRTQPVHQGHAVPALLLPRLLALGAQPAGQGLLRGLEIRFGAHAQVEATGSLARSAMS